MALFSTIGILPTKSKAGKLAGCALFRLGNSKHAKSAALWTSGGPFWSTYASVENYNEAEVLGMAVPFDLLLILLPAGLSRDGFAAGSAEEVTAAAAQREDMGGIRSYLAMMRYADVKVPQRLSAFFEEQLVAAQQEDRSVNAEKLHTWLTVCFLASVMLCRYWDSHTHCKQHRYLPKRAQCKANEAKKIVAPCQQVDLRRSCSMPARCCDVC